MSKRTEKSSKDSVPVCTADVADHTGYYFHACGRPAKRYYMLVHSRAYRCGLHSRAKRDWVELSDGKGGTEE